MKAEGGNGGLPERAPGPLGPGGDPLRLIRLRCDGEQVNRAGFSNTGRCFRDVVRPAGLVSEWQAEEPGETQRLDGGIDASSARRYTSDRTSMQNAA